MAAVIAKMSGQQLEEPLTTEQIQYELYHDCTPMMIERFFLASGFIIAFLRLLQWMSLSKKLGVISIIIIELMEVVKVFIWLLLIFLISFGGALVTLMPMHGSAGFNADGAFYIPWWAMYGEFGEIDDLGRSGGWSGTPLVWLYTFIVQIVLVNLLIAMMTETYQRIQEDADNVWKFQRVSLVDEFASNFFVPPPFSLFHTAYYTFRGCAKLMRRMRSSDDELGDDDDDDDDAAAAETRLLDAVPQEQVTTRLNPVPELLWMQSYLEDEERKATTSVVHQLQELATDRERNHAKMLENQELLEALKLRVGDISETLSKVHSSVAGAGGGPAVRRQTSVLGEASTSSIGSAPSEPSEEDTARSNALKIVEKELRESRKKLEEVNATRESELGSVRREHALAQKHEKAENTRLRTQLLRYQTREVLHVKARGPHPAYPTRVEVPDEYVDWRVPFEAYDPCLHTAKAVVDNDVTKNARGWADPMDPTSIPHAEWNSGRRASHEGDYVFDARFRPLNPRGRTGMAERGLLGKWGPNHAADPIVTRFCPERPHKLQMVAIQRRDVGQWAIPGGMVDMGESVSVTVRREFTEEAGAITDPEKKALFMRLTSELFANGELVSRGYVDDPRNTDNAWMETSVFHFHCSNELGKLLPLHAGDDAAAVMWLDIDPTEPKFNHLYASHKDFINRAVEQFESEIADDVVERETTSTA